jgi:hypothetical protein
MAVNKAVLLAESESLDWHRVKSSNLQAIAYSEDFHRLYVQFKPSAKRPAALYVYHHVEPGEWAGFLAAGSKGQYLYYVIRAKGTDSLHGYDQLY